MFNYCAYNRRYTEDTVYGKMSVGENFCSFHGFSLNRESFPVSHGFVVDNISLQKRYSKSFFQLKTQKFCPADVFLYMVYGFKNMY